MLLRLGKLLCLMILLTFSQVSHAQTIRLATGEWAPYQSSALKKDGFVTQIVVEALASEGYQVELVYMPWKRAIKEIARGGVDGSFIWTKNSEREKIFLYSDPVISLTNSLFQLNSKPIQWDKVQQLSQYRIGGLQAYSYGIEEYEKQGFLNVERIYVPENKYKKLSLGQLDLVIENTDVGMKILHRIGMADEISPNPKPITVKYGHFVAPKISPKSEKLIADFNRGLEKLKSEGKIDAYRQAARLGEYNK